MTRRLEDAVAEQAAQRPDAAAVVLNGARLTYGDLERASNRAARLLRAAGVERGDRVALAVGKSPQAIVALLATLKVGATYVPLDTASPAARLAGMVRATEPRCLVTEMAAAPLIGPLLAAVPTRPAVGWIDGPPSSCGLVGGDFTPIELAAAADGPVPAAGDSGDPAYVLFTSGSTGLPKGVVVTHANVLHFIDWAAKYFGMAPDDRASGHSPLHFDLSALDVFGTLSTGGELHLVPAGLGVAPDALPRFIREARLTQWFSVPSVLTYLMKFDAVQPADFPSLRRLMWCGEVLPTPVLRWLMRRLPHVTFTNLYGPTETTVASSYYTLPQCPAHDGAAIPIGLPCAGEELRVLDTAGEPVPDGVLGELHIGGVGVSAGYWREAAKTAAAFVTAPDGVRLYRTGDLARRDADGLVYFAGRVDSQIKSRGYRIELGEIEAALHRVPELRESAVVAVESGGFEGATICCAFAPAAEGVVTPARLRRALAATLPSYMLPTRWKRIDPLPKNANGKIDRPALRAAFMTGRQEAMNRG